MYRFIPIMKRHQAALFVALRITLAGLIAFWTGELLHLPQVYWAVLTVVVVMQPTLGGSYKLIVERVIGTIGGALWAVVVASALSPRDVVTTTIALIVALVPLALFAAIQPAYRVAPVTAIIVLLGSVQQHQFTPLYAFDRTAEISIGCGVALVLSFAFGTSAQRHLMNAAEELFKALGAQASALSLMEEANEESDYQVHLQRSRAAIARVESLAAEVRRERSSHLAKADDPEPLVSSLRFLRHDVVMLGRALTVPLPHDVRNYVAEPMQETLDAVAAYFRLAASRFASGSTAVPMDQTDATLRHCINTLERLARNDTVQISAEAERQIYRLTFALDELRADLANFSRRFNDVSSNA